MRQRLDLLLLARRLAGSREQAQKFILVGEVFVSGRRIDKPAAQVAVNAHIEIRGAPPYVSRGGIKLAGALDEFGIEVAASICADVGASTGGFTDVLLQRGAARVYAVDVGYGQLDWRLRNDARVVVMERTNIRSVSELPEPLDFAAIDVSFISLRLVLPIVHRLLRPKADAIALVKPQFEAGRAQVGRGGVVRDPGVHRAVLEGIVRYATDHGWALRGLMASPLRGPAGNVEFLAYLAMSDDSSSPPASMIESALAAAGSG